ncbi:high affinity cAMP-specific and IBMX-insensitive 3',5'-cyclic phosphodiesterase 8 isoform X3 [Aphidius gifuensis]|uniref:high affinity cAMP-specific and IBMX-insensitive 3',5'-cyclic phosphodiesterase 8 isoform X3 n=1 Tax=Aphidius gifuensis TaxID=684658 RepID=UPI001CDBDB7E|nr:high affinity cAMP-specific and IBMX-insensitive 3',5'-cyclic phosphodiesterase 8 isoform X3 [Aphidius gifuensis]XP_044008939.1 high affinity cAMP-specific and IBMX-insensitive 3',5'-cyclic phosphodiesterase 8 isoform X3 [Aphidius gifuensis]
MNIYIGIQKKRKQITKNKLFNGCIIYIGDNADLSHTPDVDFWKDKTMVGSSMFGDEDMECTIAKGPQDFNSTLSITTASQVVKVLLVFPRDDHQLEALGTVSTKLGWSVSIAKNAETAAEIFQNRSHDLVIIDRRGHRATDGDTTCRAIKATNCHHSSVILALVKKSFFTVVDKDEIVTLDLLNTGYSRAMTECTHESILSNQLIGIYASEIQPRMQFASAHALYVAVDRCRDMVHVTDDQHIVRFVNKASERLLGYKYEEMLGRNLSEIITCENFTLMDQQLQRGREFEGNMNCRRKFNDTITINCRIIPFCATGKKPSHYVYVHDTMYLLENMGVAAVTLGGQHPRGSLHSLRRGSFDVKSIGSDIGTQRRSSLQKLNNMPLEAPITKVLTLLTNAMNEIAPTNSELAMQIDKAIETLKTTELYRPYLKEDTKIYNDPISSDLLGALLSNNSHYIRDSRRSSNDSTRSTHARICLPMSMRIQLKNPQIPKEIEELLDHNLDWDFDIFSLEVLTDRKPLVYLGMNLMCRFNVPARLNCDEKTLLNWLTVIEYNYHLENSYHNSTHAADVLQATARFMQSDRLQMILEPMDEVAVLIAAGAHDIDHPGRSSQFLSNSDNKLAVLYNDLSVLESHHAALTFKLTLADENVNIFKNLDRETYKLVRQNVVDMILATEMTKHFEHLAKFVNVCSSRCGDEFYPEGPDMATLLLPENVKLVKIMMIKCADVSNPTRPLRCCIEWAKRIAEEYFNQTDEEKKSRMPVVMPMFDRNTCSIPKSQIGFVDFIINDMIEAWDAFIDMPEMISYMRQNYDKWKEYHEKGISTLSDIERLQTSSELKIPNLINSR